jgi:hypothetical protein
MNGKLIIALIERERLIHEACSTLDRSGVTFKNLASSVDHIWLAAGVDPQAVPEFSDPIFEGFETDQTAEEIHAAMQPYIKEASR